MKKIVYAYQRLKEKKLDNGNKPMWLCISELGADSFSDFGSAVLEILGERIPHDKVERNLVFEAGDCPYATKRLELRWELFVRSVPRVNIGYDAVPLTLDGQDLRVTQSLKIGNIRDYGPENLLNTRITLVDAAPELHMEAGQVVWNAEDEIVNLAREQDIFHHQALDFAHHPKLEAWRFLPAYVEFSQGALGPDNPDNPFKLYENLGHPLKAFLDQTKWDQLVLEESIIQIAHKCLEFYDEINEADEPGKDIVPLIGHFRVFSKSIGIFEKLEELWDSGDKSETHRIIRQAAAIKAFTRR
jgi:hypothetical protein